MSKDKIKKDKKSKKDKKDVKSKNGTYKKTGGAENARVCKDGPVFEIGEVEI